MKYQIALGFTLAIVQGLMIGCPEAFANDAVVSEQNGAVFVPLHDHDVPLQNDKYSCAANSAMRVMVTDQAKSKAPKVRASDYRSFVEASPVVLAPDGQKVALILTNLNIGLVNARATQEIPQSWFVPESLINQLNQKSNFFLNMAMSMMPFAGAPPAQLAEFMNSRLSPEQKNQFYGVQTARSVEDLMSAIANGQKPIVFLYNGRQAIKKPYSLIIDAASAAAGWSALKTICPAEAPNMHAVVAHGYDRNKKTITYKDPADGHDKTMTFATLYQQWLDNSTGSLWDYSSYGGSDENGQNVHMKILLRDNFGLAPGQMIVLNGAAEAQPQNAIEQPKLDAAPVIVRPSMNDAY